MAVRIGTSITNNTHFNKHSPVNGGNLMKKNLSWQ